MAEEAGRALWERMEAHHKAGYLSLHMPGHKENAALAPYLARLGAELDITELPEFDDLHDPSGVLAQGMDRAAKLWESRKSYFQVNGSTGGLLAAIRSATRRGSARRPMPRGFRFWWTRPTGPTWGSTRPFPPAPWPRGRTWRWPVCTKCSPA